MKAELVKRQDRYDLYGVDGAKIASSAPNPFGKLSKQNCDEIFGVVDVEKLASEYAKEANDISAKYGVKVFGDNNSTPFKDGFNKAMELNKDKLFTLEDLRIAYFDGARNIDCDGCPIDGQELDFLDTVKSLQQPTEIEVEIEQVLIQSSIDGEAIWKYRLDENGCLILKKL